MNFAGPTTTVGDEAATIGAIGDTTAEVFNAALIEIDRSSTGQGYSTLHTLNGVQTDLATLLANHQIALI